MEDDAVYTPVAWFSGQPGDGRGGSVDGVERALALGGSAHYAYVDWRSGAEFLIEDAPDAHVDDGREAGSWLESGAVIISVLKGLFGGDVEVAIVVQC